MGFLYFLLRLQHTAAYALVAPMAKTHRLWPIGIRYTLSTIFILYLYSRTQCRLCFQQLAFGALAVISTAWGVHLLGRYP